MYNIKAYVDGSFDEFQGMYGSGAVLLFRDDIEPFYLSDKGSLPGLIEMRNIGGELYAVILVLSVCANEIKFSNIDTITFYHDYLGIEKFATKEWKPRKPGTRLYSEAMERYMGRVNVKFVKVKAHSGEYFNNVADRLAREVLL
jgi:ribonuclease HI